MTDIDRAAKRVVSWQYLMDLLADQVTLPRIANEEWNAMERRLMRKYWREWREACQ